VCLPDSDMSTPLECFPTFSSNTLVASRLVYEIIRVVDRILGSFICGVAPRRATAFAFSLASFKSSLSSVDGSHTTLIVFPSRRNSLIAL
jgi:hypothetical protein